jgi:hypothetical protein
MHRIASGDGVLSFFMTEFADTFSVPSFFHLTPLSAIL